MEAHVAHPVALVIEDDLRRSRLTVFFRLILAIPHLIWVVLWAFLTFFVAIAAWIGALVTGAPPRGLHGLLARYVRYTVHLNAYLYLVGNPYPPFVGDPGTYPVDVRLPEAAPQERWRTLLRIVLAIPALLLSAAFAGAGTPSRVPRGRGLRYNTGGGALAASCGFLGWFASLATGRMPRGLRDAAGYSIGYNAQVLAYLLLVTDRYPNSDPTGMLEGLERPPRHPVRLVGDAHDLRRSRLTVFFRLPLAIPHIVWLLLWSIAAFLVGIVNWFATLITGTPPAAFQRFLARYLRYTLHVSAFLYLAANPFPGFAGERGRYPLDLDLPEQPQRQSRWKTFFRVFLAVPAALVNSALGWALLTAAVLTWFVSLIRGEAPWGLRNLMAWGLRYSAQLNAYVYLVTDAYPHASPLEGDDAPTPAFDELT